MTWPAASSLEKTPSRDGPASVAAESIRCGILSALPDAVAFAGGPPWLRQSTPIDGRGFVAPAERRRREFAAGRHYARSALASLGCAEAALEIGSDRAPVWPRGFVGSISHCDGFCGAVVAERGKFDSIGFDVERADPLDPSLHQFVAVPGEIAEAARCIDRQSGETAKLLFSAKEAVFKAYWPIARHFLEFDDVTVRFARSAPLFEARLLSVDAPSALGRRTFLGGYGVTMGVVFAVVLLPTGEEESDRRWTY